MKTEWPAVRLRDTGTFIQIGPFGSLLHQSDYVLGGIPLVNPTHIVAGRIKPGDREAVAPASLARLSRYLLKSGDVVMGRRGEMGRCAVVDSGTEGFLCGSGSLIMRPDPSRLTSEFLQAYISSPAGRAKLERVAQGVTMPNLNGDIVGDLEIPVPPIEEQRRIAAILDKADGLRAKRRAALAHLDALTQSIFIDMFDSGGETAALGEVVSAPLKNGTSPAAAGLVRGRVLTLSAITRGRFDESAVKDALFVKDPTIERSVRYDDFLICRGNGNPDLVGQGRYPLRGMPDTAYPDTMIAAPIPSDRMARRFMEVAWSQQSVREQIAAAARTTNGTFKVNQESLEKIRVPRPPLHEQQRFEATVFALDGMRQSSVQSGSVVDELFTSLQQRAFAGAL